MTMKKQLCILAGIGLFCFIIVHSLRCSLFSTSCTDASLSELPELDFDSRAKLYYSDSREFAHQADLGQQSNKTKAIPLTLRQAFFRALSARADKNKIIVLTSADYGFTDMALNLYYTSLNRLNITNYLYVSYDARASKILKEHGIAHFTLSAGSSTTTSNWGTSAFNKKTHIKTKIVLEALKRGFTVLILDVDIVFLKNPFPYMPCTSCDFQISSDEVEGNSGFYLVKPTKASIELHRIAANIAKHHPELSNQKALDRTMERMRSQQRIKYETLKVELFANGKSYFESGHRMFAEDNPCKDCVIVHNNWIVSGAAKIYRFKEHLMWHVDTDGYYSNTLANYLVYDNPFDFGNETTSIEVNALKAAMVLGDLLNRIVILPRFHCHNCDYDSCKTAEKKLYTTAHCSLNTHIRITTFDNAFRNAYRENVFLKHPLVPEKMLLSQSPKILIMTNKTMTKLSATDAQNLKIQLTPSNPTTGASLYEFDDLLRPYAHFKVLHFHSLYDVVDIPFNSMSMYKDFELALQNGFKKSDYRQYI